MLLLMENEWIMNYYFFPFYHFSSLKKNPTIPDTSHSMICFNPLNNLWHDFDLQKEWQYIICNTSAGHNNLQGMNPLFKVGYVYS